ncbi:MAG TPA: beta-aspartyl-peptidase [Bacillota bacterium]|nr:beta-aspartyl-peptidase [Bacillota bacterium]
MFVLLKGAHVFAPQDRGVLDVLLCGEKIVHMANEIEVPVGVGEVQVFDVSGHKLTPGLIDQHVHMIGGGGEGGPATRTPEVQLSQITSAGVTTLVGVLGTDGTTRSMEALLAKAKALEIEGLTTYVYTGAYQIPTPTITGSVRDDVLLIDKVIGVGELAISDHRSAQPTTRDVLKLAAEARVGGMLGGKPGLCHLHVGPGPAGLQPIFEMLELSDIPVTQFTPTHCDRSPALVEQSVRFAKMGGKVDLTAGSRTAGTIVDMLAAGAPLSNITFSSDGNGSMPRFDAQGNFVGLGVGSLRTLLEVIRSLVNNHGFSLTDALRPVTTNVAQTLRLTNRKGCVEVGADADLLLLDNALSVRGVFARGQRMVWDGEIVVKGTFE